MPGRQRWARHTGPCLVCLIPLAAPVSADDDLMQRPPWAACEYCHGQEGRIDSAEVPAIAGQSASYITKQLADFRAGRRASPDAQMRSATMLLDAADDSAVAAYFASRAPPVPPAVATGRSAGAMLFWRGADGQAPCAGCHAPSQRGLADAVPILFGLNDDYLARQLRAFRDGRRSNDTGGVMRAQARRLDDAAIDAVAGYLAAPGTSVAPVPR